MNDVATNAQSWADKAMVMGENYLPKVAAAIVVLVVGWILTKVLVGIFKGVLRRAKLEAGLIGFLSSLVGMGIWALVFISALGQLGVETTSFAAILASAGLAVGLALQGSLANFAAGVMILLFRPFKVGDFVEAGGATGVVKDIAIFATTINTGDNIKTIVPNAAVTGGNISNYSAEENRRVDLVFGIGYGDDLKAAKASLQKIITAHNLVLKDPAPQVVVGELADSSVNFKVRPWCKSSDYWTVYFDLHEQVKLAFDEQGISIPFPQMDVHVNNAA